MQNDTPEAARGWPQDLFGGKRALVTGGGTGLGLELSRGLAALGCHVAIASRHPENHRALLDEGQARGWSVEARQLDVREPDEVDELAKALWQEGPIDFLVNNAAGNFLVPAERISPRAWRAVLGIVLDGTFYCTRSLGKHMIARGQGRILNVVATYAWTGMPGVVHSASAKAGVLAMTRTLAVEWARHGLRVNAIAPGPFHSEGAAGNLWPEEGMQERMVAALPLKRMPTTGEVAWHCVYLLAPQSDYVNGACLTVDGALSLGRNPWIEGAPPQRPRS